MQSNPNQSFLNEARSDVLRAAGHVIGFTSETDVSASQEISSRDAAIDHSDSRDETVVTMDDFREAIQESRGEDLTPQNVANLSRQIANELASLRGGQHAA